MEDDGSEQDPSGGAPDDELFDVLYRYDDSDTNAKATLEWLEWDFSVVPGQDGVGQALKYGIPEHTMN